VDDHERRNALLGREILSATVYAAEHVSEVLHVTATVEGDDSALRSTLMTEFGFSEVGADAVLSLQVRRLTPQAIARMRSQLAEIEQSLSD
jgi:DNA gyrase/topoisomerase IV subunit A